MRDILEGSKMYSLVVTKLPVTHVTMILDDFADVLGGQLLKTI